MSDIKGIFDGGTISRAPTGQLRFWRKIGLNGDETRRLQQEIITIDHTHNIKTTEWVDVPMVDAQEAQT